MSFGWRGKDRKQLEGDALVAILRECRVCGLEARSEEDLLLFVNSLDSLFGKRNLCCVCGGKRTNNQCPNVKRSKRKYQAAKRYNVSIEEYEKNMASSNCCECCGTLDELCYDHCHTTGTFRGILCRACNRSIGQLGDTAETLKKAYEYLLQKETQ